MGITEVLTIIFVVLKLTGRIDWSWWIVCLPEIIVVALYLGVFIWDVVERIMYNGAIRKWRRGK